jgi:hypothetical protein
LFSGLSLLLGLTAAVLGLLSPFDHAAWLVAYLLLVGFAAQALLGRGQDALLGRRGDGGADTLRQGALWNAGVLAVPLGVFLDARILVVAGGAALVAALTSFWRTTRPVQRGGRFDGLSAAYVLLVAAMAISTFIGTALAWDRPWL